MRLNLKTVLSLVLILAGVVLLVIGVTTLVNLRKDVVQAVAKVFVERTDRETTAIILAVIGGVSVVVGGVLLATGGKRRKKRR